LSTILGSEPTPETGYALKHVASFHNHLLR
jgi:hypothetical protein